MKLRRHILPHCFIDVLFFSFISTIIPIGYFFGIFVLLPCTYSVGSVLYFVHVVFGTFLFFNIMTNFVFMILVDTSIQSVAFPSSFLTLTWKYCQDCDIIVPPRSWHCKICKVCILKRDHHCQFGGCCVGHKNHRYFVLFLVYFTVGCVYMMYYNTIFLLEKFNYDFVSLIQHSQFLFQLSLIVHNALGGRPNKDELFVKLAYLLFYILNIVGVVATVLFLHYFGSLMTKGLVMFEKLRNINKYDSGSVKENILQVLGERWYLTWISPFITSKLPSDGMTWKAVNIKLK